MTLVRILTPNCEGGGGLGGFTLMVLSLEHINYEESVIYRVTQKSTPV